MFFQYLLMQIRRRSDCRCRFWFVGFVATLGDPRDERSRQRTFGVEGGGGWRRGGGFEGGGGVGWRVEGGGWKVLDLES